MKKSAKHTERSRGCEEVKENCDCTPRSKQICFCTEGANYSTVCRGGRHAAPLCQLMCKTTRTRQIKNKTLRCRYTSVCRNAKRNGNVSFSSRWFHRMRARVQSFTKRTPKTNKQKKKVCHRISSNANITKSHSWKTNSTDDKPQHSISGSHHRHMQQTVRFPPNSRGNKLPAPPQPVPFRRPENRLQVE